MKKIIHFMSVLLFLSACTATPETKPIVNTPVLPEVEENSLVLFPPLETRVPNTDFKPAFEGQTRASSTQTKVTYSYSIINQELVEPWGIDVLPDGKLVITEKPGQLVILEADGTFITRISGFPSINTQNQGGLLDLSISSEFEMDSTLYFTYASLSTQGSATTIGRAELDLTNNRLNNFETVFTAFPYLTGNNHLGGRIVFDDQQNIYLTTGDRQDFDRRMQAQDPSNGNGKIHYISKDGEIVDGFSSTVFSLGHRNVQGIAIHPITKEVWANEMGPQGGDELNLIQHEKNYGWPIVSYGEEYNGNPIGDKITQKDGMAEPRYYWDPVIAPSGMIFYDGEMFKEWQNNLFIAGLKAEAIVRIVLDGDNVLAEEHLLQSEKQRFRDVAQGIDGSLYAITDAGRLYQIKSN
ncbi:MAG TPA: glucose dehydrogenase [Erysipelotrichaceae bacterium]|nr:glucose dehydrogenase [Erysipelotrichaceae bacterium]